jgi:hypothetical protein
MMMTAISISAREALNATASNPGFFHHAARDGVVPSSSSDSAAGAVRLAKGETVS